LEQQPTRLIREPEVAKRDGLSKSQRWRLEREEEYPKRIKLGPRSVAWVESEIEAWVHARIKAGGRVSAPPLPKSRRVAGAEA
jgi:prophage regulatory protein